MSIAETPREDTKPLAVAPRAAAGGLLLVVLTLVAAWFALSPTAQRTADAPAGEFSAERARGELERLNGQGAAHPAGSPQNRRVREALLERLEELGFAPETQAFPVAREGTVARPVNVLATLEGREPGAAVALVAHYDSVPAGAGAADDGAGVAALLEIARALTSMSKDGPAPRNTVVFLFTDAEETGLHGAKAFVDRHPLAQTVRAVVNLEARGTEGPSLLFETGAGSAGLIDAYAAGARRPVAGSAFAWVYERLPNDTDFSVLVPRGGDRTGVNLAFIQGVARYHTPLDDLDHLSSGSLQHQGENALGMVRQLAEADLDALAGSGEAVYFDVFALAVVRWPAGWTLALALGALLALVALALVRIRGGSTHGRAVAAGAATMLLTPVTLAAAGVLVGSGLGLLGALVTPFPAHSLPVVLTHWGIAVAGTLALVTALGRLGRGDLWAGTWIAWAVVALALSAYAPPIAYPLVAPAVIAAVAGWCGHLLRPRAAALLAAWLPPVAAALVWAPFAILLPDAMGVRLSYGMSLPAAFVLAACAPLLVQIAPRVLRLATLTALCIAVVAAIIAAVVQPFDADHPQPITIRYHRDADAGTSWWVVYARGGGLPPALVSAGGLIEGNHSPDPAPGWATRTWSGPAPLAGVLEPVGLKNVERKQTPQGVDVVGRFVSPRGPRRISLTLPDADGFAGLWIDGALLHPREFPDGSLRFRAVTVPPNGVRFRIIRRGDARLQVLVADETPGLPRAGLGLIDARGPRAAPYNDADATIVSTLLRF